MKRIYWQSTSGINPVFTLHRLPAGSRLDLGPDFDELILLYGEFGVLRGCDHRGVAYQEVRQLDFGDLPRMHERDHARLMQLVHTPEYVMIHASGQKVSKPVTGHWVRAHESDFDRLAQMPILGEVLS